MENSGEDGPQSAVQELFLGAIHPDLHLNCSKTLLEFCNSSLSWYFTSPILQKVFHYHLKLFFVRLDTLLALHWPLKITMVLKATFSLHHQFCLLVTQTSSYSPFLLICALSVPCYFYRYPLGSLQFVFFLNSVGKRNITF